MPTSIRELAFSEVDTSLNPYATIFSTIIIAAKQHSQKCLHLLRYYCSLCRPLLRRLSAASRVWYLIQGMVISRTVRNQALTVFHFDLKSEGIVWNFVSKGRSVFLQLHVSLNNSLIEVTAAKWSQQSPFTPHSQREYDSAINSERA